MAHLKDLVSTSYHRESGWGEPAAPGAPPTVPILAPEILSADSHPSK